MKKIKFEEGYIDKDILKKMNKREKALEDKIKLLEGENKKIQEIISNFLLEIGRGGFYLDK